MVTKISFTNKANQIIPIIVEPEAVHIDLEKDKSLEMELIPKAEQVEGKIQCVMKEGGLVVYQNIQYEMKMYIDNELQYW